MVSALASWLYVFGPEMRPSIMAEKAWWNRIFFSSWQLGSRERVQGQNITSKVICFLQPGSLAIFNHLPILPSNYESIIGLSIDKYRSLMIQSLTEVYLWSLHWGPSLQHMSLWGTLRTLTPTCAIVTTETVVFKSTFNLSSVDILSYFSLCVDGQ
jgi:hypothetical protein